MGTLPPSGAPPPETPPETPPSSLERGVVTADPATPYHRLARTRRHRWWRPALGTLLLIVTWLAGIVVVLGGFAVTALVTGTDFLTGGTRFFANPVLNVAVLLGIVLVAGPAVALAAWVVQRRPVGSVSSVNGRLRWRWLVSCLGLAVPTILVSLSVLYSLPPPGGAVVGSSPGISWVGWRRFLIAAAVLVMLVPMQSAAEEYVFRGWVIQTAGAYLRSPWVGIMAGAVLFALAHGLGTAWGFADLLLFGILSGWLAVRTGGLEAGIALHTVNNLVAFLLSAAFGSLGVIRTAAQASWTLFAVDIVVLPLYAWLVISLAGRTEIARTVPVPPAAT